MCIPAGLIAAAQLGIRYDDVSAGFGNDGGTTGIDDDFAARGFRNVGAWIMARNMFGPVRNPRPDES